MSRLVIAVIAGAALAALAPSGARADSGRRLVTNTEYVEDVAVLGDVLWAATRGGLESYSLASGRRTAVFTTEDGLDSNHVWQVDIIDTGTVVARTHQSSCALVRGVFVCSAAQTLVPEPAVAPRFQGARVTERLAVGQRVVVATAGAGVWLEGTPLRRLTPDKQICSNHIISMTEFAGRLWLGSFDEGLCSSADGGRTFLRHDGPFRMVNDLEVTPRGLYIAAGEGLFRTVDGASFEKVEFVSQRGVNGLAYDGRSLYVTTPGALWRIRINGGRKTKAWWLPGGSRSLQGVAAANGSVWVATEDRGALRMTLTGFEIYDRARGLPSSWGLDVAIKGGKAYLATLRHGVVEIGKSGKSRQINVGDNWMLYVGNHGGELWAGTQAGVARLGKNNHDGASNLPHPNVHVVHRTAEVTYLGTELGLLVTPQS